MLRVVKGYARLTVRQLYYILVSRFKYSANRAFYKRMNRYLCKVRRANPEVHVKFIDPTRQFVLAPLPYSRMEIWVEKDSIRNFIANLAAKYRLSIQVPERLRQLVNVQESSRTRTQKRSHYSSIRRRLGSKWVAHRDHSTGRDGSQDRNHLLSFSYYDGANQKVQASFAAS